MSCSVGALSAPRRLRAALGLAVVVALLDQASKWVILLIVMQPPRVIEVTSFFNLVLTFNRGVSFGLFSGALWWKPYALAALAGVIVVGLLLWLRSQPGWLPTLAVGAIVGGALGNVVDRFVHGAVVDFLDFHAAGLHWPAFNLADSCIVVGVGLLLFNGLFGEQQGIK